MRLQFVRALRTFSTSAVRLQTQQGSAGPKPVSMTPEGTVMKGLNVRKNGEDPVALKDEEYPEWLWQVLDEKAQKTKLDKDPELKAAHERRQANRKLIKNNNFLSTMNN